ncbi:MAG: class I tRNA ligase family protein, partial [Patescibacteria group bacterium]
PRLDFIFKDKKYDMEEEIKGSDLIGMEYEPPYRIFASKEGEFKVYSYKGMVTMEDGTGIVHSAPGFGEIDTEMGKHFGLTLMMTLNDEGEFLPGTDSKNPYEGMFYLKSNNLILEDLEKRNILFRNERTVHRVPYHDRCNTLLVQKAQNSWFINIQSVKDKLIETNKSINWIPEYIKHGVFEKTIEQAPDWCISRNRFWATPMPVWESSDGDRIVVSSIKEIEELSGQKVTDLHRPYIDSIIIKKDGKEYKRRTEVLDSWMEAGSMPFAQIHYPFENQEKFEKNFPGDYIVEYKGQIRAWFQRMHIMSTLLFESRCFNNCVVTGVMAGSDGRKMSKTYKNYTDPKDVILNYGGDALRLYLMDSPLMSGENTNFDETELKIKLRNVLNPLWNSVKYFLIYANLHNWDYKKSVVSKNVLDKWIVARLHQVIKDFDLGLKSYNIPPSVRSIEDFVDDLSRWYVRRSRDRITEGDNEALSTLYYVLVTFAKASAPAIPFVCENIYRNLVSSVDASAVESVHLCDYPDYDEKILESAKDILKNMEKARKIVSSALSIRVSKSIPVRQVLGSLEIKLELSIPNEYFNLVLSEVNVKEMVFVDSLDENQGWIKDEPNLVSLNTELTPELIKEGLLREFIRKVQDLRKELGLLVSDEIVVTYEKGGEMESVISEFSNDIKKKIGAMELKPGEDFSVKKI